MTKLQTLKDIIIKTLVEGTTFSDGVIALVNTNYPFEIDWKFNDVGNRVCIEKGFYNHIKEIYGITDFGVKWDLHERYIAEITSKREKWLRDNDKVITGINE
jgi:hypothetical protein